MNCSSFIHKLYALNPRIVSSIKSPDSLAILGPGAPFELPLAFFQVLMVFAEPKTVAEAFQMLEVDVDINEFEEIIRDFIGRDLLTPYQPDDDGAFDLRRLLTSRISADLALVNQLGASMREGRAILIPDALPGDFAEEVHRDLCRSSHWTVAEGSHDFFHYRNSAISHLEDHRPALAKCSQLFKSKETRRLISELSGQDCAGEASVAATWYRSTEYALPHDDSYASEPRSVAYIWYLTKDWQREWGGSLFWCPTGQYIAPRFNMLLMFRVMPSNVHLVCPVSPVATGKRLTINGFWTRSERSVRAAQLPTEGFISPPSYGFPSPEGGELPWAIIL